MKAEDLVRPAVAAMSGYVPGEQPVDTGLVKLNTNENPYPASPRVVAAMAAEAAGDMQLYPSPDARPLREEASRRYGVDPSAVLAGNGSDEILSILLKASVEPGDRVALCEPTYSLYRTLCSIAGAKVQAVQVAAGEWPGPSFAEGAKIVFVCTPNAPYGTEVPLEAIAELADGFPGIVVADEAYVDFGGRSALALLPSHSNLVVTRTFSKSFSLAGLRLGLAFAAPSLVAQLAKVKDSYNISRIAVAAGVAALEDYQHMEANVAQVVATRDRVAAVLRARGWVVPPSAANFLWVVPRDEDASSLYLRLRAAKVLARWFDTDQLRHGLRVSIGTDEQMDRFLEASEPA